MSTAKAWVAIIGSAVTAALGLFPPDTNVYRALTILSAVLTAAAVYVTPNSGLKPS